jgi:uncharacterized protein YecE (DUF72 family)
MKQTALFDEPEESREDGQRGEPGSVAPAAVDEEHRALAARLPPEVRLGTSSWSFPGWKGLVYRDEHREQVLARRGLGAYAAHPLLGSVGLDRTFYAPVAADVLAAYAAAVPVKFRFLVKAHEALTLARYPRHPRYGAQRGLVNPLLLDVGWARDQVVAPFVEGLGEKGGVLLFQFAPQSAELFAGEAANSEHKSAPRRFAERLYRFLRDLPQGPRYAVEVRTADLLTPDLVACLRAAGVVPCLAAMRGLPPLDVQAQLTAVAEVPGPLVVRWLLAPQHDYEGARVAYRPFNRLVEPDPDVRTSIARLITEAVERGEGAFVIVNNKAEGSSPLSIVALARALNPNRDRPARAELLLP